MIERIYIGGLDPPRLTAQDVLGRLPKGTTTMNTPTVEIQSIECHPDKPYCHVTATMGNSDSSSSSSPPISTDTSSAFQILFKTFNNVKWKGCRLTVQMAKPRFLDRLRQEIEERQELQRLSLLQESPKGEARLLQPQSPEGQQQEDENGTESVDNNNNNNSQLRPTRRRLKIRRKFGEEAYHVDTQPWMVENWSHFRIARDRLKKRKEKYQQEINNTKNTKTRQTKKGDSEQNQNQKPIPPPLMIHRAVHFRFQESLVSSSASSSKLVTRPHEMDSSDIDEDQSLPRLEASEEEESSESEASTTFRENQLKETTPVKTEYAWSDDDDDDDEESEDDESEDDDPVDVDAKSQASSESDDPAEEENSTRKVMAQATNPPKQNQTVSSKTEYHWSSSDDDSSHGDDRDGNSSDRRGPLRQVSQTDEFAAGFDTNDFVETENDDDDDGEDELLTMDHTSVGQDDNNDLTGDVTANLKIFAGIFSDVEGVKPAIEGETDETDKERKKTSKQQPQNGFGKSGMMLRYDPNDVTMQQFEIEEEEDQTETSRISPPEDDEGKQSPQIKEPESKNETDPVHPQEETGHIYEEKMLESVFRTARDTWTGTADGEETKVGGSSGGGLFSFGFDLGPVEPDMADVGTPDGPTPTTNQMPDPSHDDPKGTTETNDVNVEPKISEKRIVGFCFPDDLLTKYQTEFFTMNNNKNKNDNDTKDGDNVDPSTADDREAWTKERHALTVDWKRKRKHAETRIQKRMKMR